MVCNSLSLSIFANLLYLSAMAKPPELEDDTRVQIRFGIVDVSHLPFKSSIHNFVQDFVLFHYPRGPRLSVSTAY